MRAYLAVFVATALVTVSATPLVRRLPLRVGAIDYPSDRKVHATPTPTIGGLAMLLGILAGLGVAWLTPTLRPAFRFSSQLQGALYAAVAVAVLGVIDDLRTLSAPAKAAGQILAAGLLVLNGVELLFFWVPKQGVISLGADLAVPLTILWVLVLVNAVNLIDGLDGLAAGIVAIAAASFFVYSYRVPPTSGSAVLQAAPVLCAVVAGACVGFLPWNFHPARIIMGDTGSMLLGMLLAAATISAIGRTLQPTGHDLAAFSIPVLIPVLVLAVPLLDVALAIVRRLRNRRPVFAPDKAHIHHQLREIGHSHRQAVLLMYLWSAVLAGSALGLTYVSSGGVAAATVAFAVLVVAGTLVPRVRRVVRTARAARVAARTGEPDRRG
jgi:UDP-GlcNAc:undecaprenyl-phosphate/decaprenyl-phosphate GlcNAc-1-phosphate transferase